MHLDAIDLKEFYASPLGAVVRRLLGARLRARWSDLNGQSLFGLGFPTPFIGAFRTDASPLGALMPAELGAVPWPNQGDGMSVLVDETELPLPDECADRIVLVHMLEWSERTRQLLREVWRVLAPNGRLLLIVPNRRGLWARVDTTPFGHGRPFSRSQLVRLLKEAMFSPEDWQHALYMPPFSWRVLLKWPVFWERLGLVLWPAFSGVLMVEASKQIYAGVPVKEVRGFRRRVVPVPAAVTAHGMDCRVKPGTDGVNEKELSATRGTPPARRTNSA
jgi:SAM-dependent methyltransferase